MTAVDPSVGRTISQNEFNIKAGLSVSNPLDKFLIVFHLGLLLPSGYGVLSGVVRGEGPDHIIGVPLKESFQVMSSKGQIEIRLEEVFGLNRGESLLSCRLNSGGGKKLHQPGSGCRRDGLGIKQALLADQGQHQKRVQPSFL